MKLAPISSQLRSLFRGLILGTVMVAAEACFESVPEFPDEDETDTDADSDDVDLSDGNGSSGSDDEDASEDGGSGADTRGDEGDSHDEGDHESSDDEGSEDTGTSSEEGGSESDGDSDGSGTGTGDEDDADSGTGSDEGDSTDSGSDEGDSTDSGSGSSDGESSEDNGDGDSDDSGSDPTDCPATTHACAAEVAGWVGPVALGQAGLGGTLPACSGDYATGYGNPFFRGLAAPPAECTCTCVAAGARCEASVGHATSGCLLNQTTWVVGPNSCTAVNMSASGSYAVADVRVVDTGECRPSSSTTVEPPTWSQRGRMCAFTGTAEPAACPAGRTCVPRPNDDFGALVCIYRPGAHACPSSYPTQVDWFHDEAGSLPDDRGCSSCTCEGPTGDICRGDVLLYPNDQCADPTERIPVGTCRQLSLIDIILPRAGYEPVTGGTCSEEGGEPTGDATPEMPATVCCL